MKKIREVVFNATVYRSSSVCLQLAMVLLVFGLSTNWKVVAACNVMCFLWYIVYHIIAIHVRHYYKHRPRPTIKVYLSHPIRGSKVDNATKAEQMSNSERARLAAVELRKRFPELDIYCPGEAEEFVGLTYSKGLLTDAQILEIDCEILGGRDCVFAYAFDSSNGMKIEADFADDRYIPILTFDHLGEDTFKQIREFIDKLGSKWDDYRMGL